MMFFAQDPAALPIFIFFAVFVVIVFFAIIYGMQLVKKRDLALQQLARQLGGKIYPSGLLSFPELHFPHGNRTAALKWTAGGENEETRTHLTIQWPNGRLRSEIFPEGRMSGLRKLIGMQDIQIGSPDFDRQFIITGNDDEAIKAFLTPEAQARLFDLYRFRSGTLSVPNLYLQIAAGGLKITKTSYLTDTPTLERFIELFLRFYDAATGSHGVVSSAGIEFLDPPKADDTAPRCIVCGEPMTTDLVTCRSCRTPHHKDCWHYFGGCATYACGGKLFRGEPSKGERTS